jgi:hypothetical protein
MTLRRTITRHKITTAWQPLFFASEQLAKEIALCLSGCFPVTEEPGVDENPTPISRPSAPPKERQ